MKIAICIPTYNRVNNLVNCLKSILHAKSVSNIRFEICISDNNSTDGTENAVRDAQKNLEIKYHKNKSNLGYARNFIKAVSLAESDFIWLIGDDDLLMPDAISRLINLIDSNPRVDFFYVNSYLLEAKFFKNVEIPFDIEDLPIKMKCFSSYQNSGEMPFIDLIDPKISFDFLGGMFLSVFRKSLWDKNLGCLDKEAIVDKNIFSHFDNTFPHIKIFSNAFSKSTAYYNKKPLIISLSGAREWEKLYPLVHSVRLVESLAEYRKNGLTFWNYYRCKNFALSYAIPHYYLIWKSKRDLSYKNISLLKLILESLPYPNFYLSVLYYFIRIIKRYIAQSIFKGAGSDN